VDVVDICAPNFMHAEIAIDGMEDFFEAYGTDGVVKVEMSHGSPVHVYSRKGYAYAMEKAEQVKGTRAEDGLEVMRVIDAIDRSSQEGRTVELLG
jgi:predicted dehydrogenase